MFIELIVPMNSTGGRERDVMDEDIIAAGMQPVQMIGRLKAPLLLIQVQG
jgi:hypothetical protein